MSAPSLRELRALHEAATPEEWTADAVHGTVHPEGSNCRLLLGPMPDGPSSMSDYVRLRETARANAALIAAARNALPLLLDIAEAAIEWHVRQTTTKPTLDVLLAALEKVRP